MRCQDFTANATELMEGALGWRQRIAMRMHLLICDACSGFLQQMRRTMRLVGSLPATPPPPGTEERLMSSLPEAAPPGRQDDP